MYDIKIERRNQIQQSAEEPSQSRQNNDAEKMMDTVEGEAIDAAVAGETTPFGDHEVVDTHQLSTTQVNAMDANNDDSDNVNSDNSTPANPQKETPDNETMDNPLETNRNNLNNSPTSMTANHHEEPIIAPLEMKELQLMFDYAVWAYEPDETTLRSLLLTGKEPAAKGKGSKTTKENESKGNDYDTASNDHGYRLIVHRTTSYIDPTQRVLLPNEEDNHPKSKTESAKKKKKNLRKPPGRVGYFVAVSRAKRTLLIGMKGTSTLEELLTDCCGRAVRVDLENDPHDNTEDDGADNNDCYVENDDDDFVQDDGSGFVEAKIEEVDRPEDENTTTRSSILIRHDEWDEKWDDAQDDNLLNSKMISSSADGLEKNDSGDGMMDMVHVSTSNRACPSESVEVELIHGDNQLLGFSNSASSVKSTSVNK